MNKTTILVRSVPGSRLHFDTTIYEQLEINGDSQVVSSQVGVYAITGRTKLVVLRSNEVLPITVSSDLLSRTIYLRPKLSGLYQANILNLGFGFRKDKDNLNRYTYPRKVYIDLTDTGNTYTYYRQPGIGEIQLMMTPPIGNVYNFSLGREIQAATPIIGSAVGLNYWYARSRAISLEVGGAIAATPYCYDGCRFIDSIASRGTRQSTSFASVQHHNRIGRLDIGYGIYLGKRKWQIHKIYMDTKQVLKTNTSSDLGLVISSRFQLFPFMHLGFEYQPHFFAIMATGAQKYQHLLMIGAQFRLSPDLADRR